jgi:hypothetical protein
MKMESFTFRGTSDQVAKVVEWAKSKGFEDSHGDSSEAPTVVFIDTYDHKEPTYQTFGSFGGGDTPAMPPELELEIFGRTEGITGKVEHPWALNRGNKPIGVMKVDVKFRNGKVELDSFVDSWAWSIEADCKHDYDITHWRLHTPDAEYFVAPATPVKRDIYSEVNEGFDALEKDVVRAPDILTEAAKIIGTRGVERDKGDSERSMQSCVNAFNALTKHTLTEEQGWLFMVVLKMARSQGGCFKLDDYLDGAAYFALAGEAAAKGGV